MSACSSLSASLGTLKLVERRLNSATRRIRSLTIASARTGWAAISRLRAAHTCSSTQGKQAAWSWRFPPRFGIFDLRDRIAVLSAACQRMARSHEQRGHGVPRSADRVFLDALACKLAAEFGLPLALAKSRVMQLAIIVDDLRIITLRLQLQDILADLDLAFLRRLQHTLLDIEPVHIGAAPAWSGVPSHTTGAAMCRLCCKSRQAGSVKWNFVTIESRARLS
jgi:hypothetical protein